MTEAGFFAEKQKSGLVHALRVYFPGYAADVRRTHEERQKLLDVRRAFIDYVMQKEGVGFSEAERIVDRNPK